jgi:hypothetical protein
MPNARRFKLAVDPVTVEINGETYAGTPAITEQVWDAWASVDAKDFRRRSLILTAITFGKTESELSKLPVAVTTILQEVSNEINQLEVVKDAGEGDPTPTAA